MGFLSEQGLTAYSVSRMTAEQFMTLVNEGGLKLPNPELAEELRSYAEEFFDPASELRYSARRYEYFESLIRLAHKVGLGVLA